MHKIDPNFPQNNGIWATFAPVQANIQVWQALLEQALKYPVNGKPLRGVDAIIDCGALLAGVDLR